MLGRVPEDVILRLNLRLSVFRIRAAVKIADGITRQVAYRTCGQAFFDEVWTAIGDAGVASCQYCYSHGTECPLHPPPEVRGDNLYIVVGGNTCTPWSTLGGHDGWLHAATLAFVVWMRDVLQALPEVVIQECTVHFDIITMEKCLSPTYNIQQVKFSPEDVGVPTRRLRSYAVCVRNDCKVLLPWTKGALRQHAFRQCLADGSIFLRATRTMLDSHHRAFAHGRGLADVGSPWRLLLCGGDRERLQA